MVPSAPAGEGRAAHLCHPGRASFCNVSLVCHSEVIKNRPAQVWLRGLLSSLYLTGFVLPSSTLNAFRSITAGSRCSVRPRKRVLCVKSSPPQSRSCCFCPITHSKQLYKMALGFLFPHNLCMWSSIMGSFIMSAAPLWSLESFRLSVQLLSTLWDGFCTFCEKPVCSLELFR